MRIGTDTGGTFTDVVADDGRIVKVPSTPHDPGEAVRRGVAEVLAGAGSGSRLDELAHGTTVATNAVLERRLARVALVTTAGFADVIEIARQDRPSLYDQMADRPEPLVPRELRLEVHERLAADGTELAPVDPAEVAGLAVPDDVDAVAVCLLHSDLDPTHEQQVAEGLRARGVDVSASHEVSPELREYERTVTTVVNAALRPVCRTYLQGLGDVADDVLVMTSAGGLVPAAEAAEQPASLLLSGPAGGVAAAAAIAAANGFADVVTFDMGGTSTDVCLVLGGRPEPAAERSVDGYPVRLPSLDVHTVGAGGGSIARLDAGGALVVGPESAGAVPGPACYGRGGARPTVTDADLVSGRIPRDATFPGLGRLDVAAAERAIADAGVTAAGIVEVVDAMMEQALRVVTVARGVDPRDLALVAFGGAGPLHACALADALGLRAVLVPPRAGVLSAVGILCADRRHDRVHTWPTPLDHTGLDETRAQLTAAAVASFGAATPTEQIEVTTALDCRYLGQGHELSVGSLAEFEREHERRNGYARPGHPIEVVAVRATAVVRGPLTPAALPVPDRPTGVGPTVLAEADCTIWVPEGWRADLGEAGALVLTRTEAGS